MPMFRSEDMAKCQMYLQTETIYDFVKELGNLGIMQFNDLCPDVNAFQRTFVNEVRRCEEMERQIRFFENELSRDGVEIQDVDSNPEAPEPKHIVDLEATFQTHEEKLKEVTNNIDTLKLNFFELTELKCVLQHAQELFTDLSAQIDNDLPTNNLLLDAHDALHTLDMELVDMDKQADHLKMKVEFITGVLPQKRLPGFMRMLWFACHGNQLLRYAEMPETVQDVNTGLEVQKIVFIIFFQGQQLERKIKKICDGYHANVYPCPDTRDEREETLRGVIARLSDIETVIAKSQEQRTRLLAQTAKNVHAWNVKVTKVKAIYHTMNMFSAEGKHFIAEGYYPRQQHTLLQGALRKATFDSQTSLPSLIHPVEAPDSELPTYHSTNKFTAAYQTLVDAYGHSSYKEMNPAPFSIITFPFLFAVMFGDAGHGVIMLAFAVFMLWKEEYFLKHQGKNEIWDIFFGGRYIILLMSIFSIYCGILYNDFFAKSVNIFGSSWTPYYDNRTLGQEGELMLDPSDPAVFSGSPYPFGIDPVWQISRNKITFANGFKKKVSIILGVMQMLLGLFLSLANHIYFRQPLNILCEFIPQMLFLLAMFGYLCALMFAKWIVFSPEDSACAPSLLLGLINMFLLKYPDEPCSTVVWYNGQRAVESFLLVLIVLCIPWMLFIKPLYLKRKHRLAQTEHSKFTNEVEAEEVGIEMRGDFGESSTDADTAEILPDFQESKPPRPHKAHELEEFDFGETMIHQSIHTIEFCLGCISHTASYLRLWALSLAHTQLSEVLWNMVFRNGLLMSNSYAGAVVIFGVFSMWACMTIAILLLMEGLSAFLHTLRLHWVEFQSKFYKGEGHPFEPLNFTEILKHKDDKPS